MSTEVTNLRLHDRHFTHFQSRFRPTFSVPHFHVESGGFARTKLHSGLVPVAEQGGVAVPMNRSLWDAFSPISRSETTTNSPSKFAAKWRRRSSSPKTPPKNCIFPSLQNDEFHVDVLGAVLLLHWLLQTNCACVFQMIKLCVKVVFISEFVNFEVKSICGRFCSVAQRVAPRSVK